MEDKVLFTRSFYMYMYMYIDMTVHVYALGVYLCLAFFSCDGKGRNA